MELYISFLLCLTKVSFQNTIVTKSDNPTSDQGQSLLISQIKHTKNTQYPKSRLIQPAPNQEKSKIHPKNNNSISIFSDLKGPKQIPTQLEKLVSQNARSGFYYRQQQHDFRKHIQLKPGSGNQDRPSWRKSKRNRPGSEKSKLEHFRSKEKTRFFFQQHEEHSTIEATES